MSRYSRLSIPVTELAREALATQIFFDDLSGFWSSGHISPELVLKIYMTAYQVLRTEHSASFQNRLPLNQRTSRSKQRAQELKENLLGLLHSQKEISLQSFLELDDSLNFLFSEYNFISIPGEVTLQLHELSRAQKSLRVIGEIPSPLELLQLQAQGQRVVTLHMELSQRGQFVDDKRDSYEFALHDLSHAYKFFHTGSYSEQVKFFQLFLKWMNEDPQFYQRSSTSLKDGLDYVMSDMNSHPKHLLQTLEAHLNLANVKMAPQYRTEFENLAIKQLTTLVSVIEPVNTATS